MFVIGRLGIIELKLAGGNFHGTPRAIQLLKGIEGFLAARTVKFVPGVLVKPNWKLPLGSLAGLTSTMLGNAGEMSRILEALGMPLTKTVASA